MALGKGKESNTEHRTPPTLAFFSAGGGVENGAWQNASAFDRDNQSFGFGSVVGLPPGPV